MSSYKRQFLIQSYQQQQQQQQQAQEDTPWLKYPDPQRSSSNGHSRSFNPIPPHKYQPTIQHSSHHGSSSSHQHASSRSETHPTRLHHKRSSSKLLLGTSSQSSQFSSNHSHHAHSNNSSNASLPMSLAGSNSSSDSLGHNHPYHHQHQNQHQHNQPQPRPFTSTNNSNKPRTLSEELSFAMQSSSNSNGSSADDIHRSNSSSSSINSNRHPYPSPITPSDLLSIPDLSASPSSASPSSSSSTTSLASPFPLQRTRVDSGTGQKLRPSPLSLSINTTNLLSNYNNPVVDAPAFPFPPTQQPQQHQSPASVSRGSTVADGLALGSPCANLTMSSSSSAGLGTPPLPRLTHSLTHSSSSSSSASSASSCSNTSSPSSSTPPCSALCHHHHSSSKGHSHHRHNHHKHRHSSSCHLHKHQPREREHHPSCHLHQHNSKSDRAPPKGVLRFDGPPTPKQHEGVDVNASSSFLLDEAVVAALPEPTLLHLDDMPMAIEKAPASTAVTIVGSTPTYGMGAYRAQREQEEAAENALGLYSAEPPKKRQRSTAAVLFGAAFETVIFTSAIALSAYQLLTGRGRQQGAVDASVGAEGETTPSAAEENAESLSADQTMLPIESAPVNIPTRMPRHQQTSGHGHMLGKSLHHHHHQGRHLHHNGGRSRHHHPKSSSYHHNKNGGNRHGLSASLPHANPQEPDHPFYERALVPPKRPNTGTEDSDEQFLRMEAKLSTLIAEGKRALSSRIQDHVSMETIETQV